MNAPSFSDQVFWISGASSGIGKALALRLAQAGARVALTARRAHVLDRLPAAAPACCSSAPPATRPTSSRTRRWC